MQRLTLPMFSRRHYRGRMTLLMLAADLLGIGLAGSILGLLDFLLDGLLFATAGLEFLVVFLAASSLFAFSRLYPGVGLNPAEEMRLVSQYLGAAFFIGLLVLAFSAHSTLRHYLTLFVAWLCLPACILLVRWGGRILAAQRGLWGEPVAVLGQAAPAARLAKYFLERRRLGFVPVLVVTSELAAEDMPVPVISLSHARQAAGQFAEEEIMTLLVEPSALSNPQELVQNRALFDAFQSIILVTDLDWLGGASLFVNDYEGLVGMEAQRNSLRPGDLLAKRLVDLLLGALLAVLTLPLVLLAALLVKLDSPGPAFYSQERLGKGGRRIRIFKLRSMVQDAEQALQAHLQAHPQARQEWEQCQKLKDDPRITRVGRWLRRLSLDELPQVYNILRGEMSLVGPRPLPEYHHNLLTENLRTLRASVRPGLTGMWQVSGRSDSGNHGLEVWDAYYVHNWSLWLDLYILMRTVWVIISRDGAY